MAKNILFAHRLPQCYHFTAYTSTKILYLIGSFDSNRYLNQFFVLKLQKSKRDVLNFDPEFTKEDPVLTPVNPEVVRTIEQAEFAGFSFYNSDYGKLSSSQQKKSTK